MRLFIDVFDTKNRKTAFASCLISNLYVSALADVPMKAAEKAHDFNRCDSEFLINKIMRTVFFFFVKYFLKKLRKIEETAF